MCRKAGRYAGAMPSRPTLSPRGSAFAAAVLAGHLALLAGLLSLRPWPARTRSPKGNPALMVWLLPAAWPTARSAALPAPTRPRSAAAPAPPRAPRHARAALQAITLSVTPEAASAALVTGPAAPPTRAPLRLRLPDAVLARPGNPALADPRADSPRPTLESRIARVLDHGNGWVEEPLGEGRVRYRRGSECIEVRPARIDQLDPFNRSALPVPGVAKRC